MAYWKCLYNASRNEFERVPYVTIILEAPDWIDLPDNVYSIESFNYSIRDWGNRAKFVLRVYYYNSFLDPSYQDIYISTNGLSDVPNQMDAGSNIINAEFIGYTLAAFE